MYDLFSICRHKFHVKPSIGVQEQFALCAAVYAKRKNFSFLFGKVLL